MSDSYWLSEPVERLPQRPLEGRVDVAIVGGGITGCSCALALAGRGARVRLYEAREIAGGASGRNGGFALRGGAMPYHVARERFGRDRARAFWRLTERYVDRFEELAGDAFARVGSLRVAADADERRDLAAEYEALRDDRFDVAWVDQLAPPLDGRFHGGLRHPGDGSLRPARAVRRIARRAAEAGADVRQHTRVHSLEDLDADQFVLALDGYAGALVPSLAGAIRPTRGQVLTTAPLAERLFDCPVYARWGYDYWQQLDDGRLVIGGWRDTNLEREFTHEERTTPDIQEKIEAFVVDFLGHVPTVTHRWAGIFGMTSDRLPLVGRLPGYNRGWIAAGYSGHGNVLGLACGELVADAISGASAPELELFDPARLL